MQTHELFERRTGQPKNLKPRTQPTDGLNPPDAAKASRASLLRPTERCRASPAHAAAFRVFAWFIQTITTRSPWRWIPPSNQPKISRLKFPYTFDA